VYKTAVENDDKQLAEYALKVVPQDLLGAMLPHSTHERGLQLTSILGEFSQQSKPSSLPAAPLEEAGPPEEVELLEEAEAREDGELLEEGELVEEAEPPEETQPPEEPPREEQASGTSELIPLWGRADFVKEG
jgi:hypothetical protein